MIKKIFHSILFTSMSVIMASLLIVVSCLYYYFEHVQEQQLHSALVLATQALKEDTDNSYIENLNSDDLRLTLISNNGTVIADTAADPSSMENHSNREEIKEAFMFGSGESSRYSSTLTEKNIYRAVLLDNGNVLRISVSQATVFALILGIIPWLIPVAIFATVLSWTLAKHLSKKIINPLNQIDLDNPLKNDTYEEISPLLLKIHHQHQQIDTQLLQIKQKNDEFNYITENMKEALVLLNSCGKILSINNSAISLFGIKSNAVGENFLTVERSHKISNAIDVAMREGYKRIKEEKNGRNYQFDISRIESDGKIIGLVILAFDVSEQEYAEQSRREFSANVSHELKTPLTSVIASADMIENGIVKPEDMPRFIGHIKKEAIRLLNLIDDIIRLSQLDEGVEMAEEIIDINAMSVEVINQLQDTADKKNVHIELNAENCILKGVPRLLHEIIYNLLENAIKYNVTGGSVTVTITKAENICILKVCDTGIGIPAEHQEHIFERFYRVDKSHSKQSGGTGLGLSIVKHAATYFNAKISVESEQGKGTAITVVFPI